MTVVVDTPAMQEADRVRRETIARRTRLTRRARGCCVWFVAFAVVAGLGTWFFVTAFTFADQRAGEQALAQARADGTPLTLTDLASLSPRGREIDEATNHWRKAIEHVDLSFFHDPAFMKVPVIGANRIDEGTNPPDRDDRGRLQGEDLDSAKQFVSQFDKALVEARAAREAGGVANFAVTADGRLVNYGNTYPLIYLSNVLRLRAETRLSDDDVEGALDDLATMSAICDAMRSQPYDWQQRGRHQTLHSSVALVERMLATEALNDDQLKRLDRTFVAEDEAESFRLVLAGSRFQFVDLVQRDDQAIQGMLRIERSSLTRGADLAKGLDIFRRMDQASEKGLIEALDAWKSIEAELAELGGEPAAQVRYPGTLMLVPSLGQQAQSHLQAEATVTIVRTAIACERYRLANGELPTKLDALTPEFLDQAPLDPCDGKPLRYVNDAGGVRLYSIGPDLIDHSGGGAISSGAVGFAPSDIVFRLKKSRAGDSSTQP